MTSIEELIKQHQQRSAERKASQVKISKPFQGKNKYRILPGWREDQPQQFWQYFGQHWIKKAGKVVAVAVCKDRTFGESCEICNAIAEGIRSSNDDDLIKELKQANAQQVQLVNALHLNGPTPDEPIVLAIPSTLFENLVSIVTSGYGFIMDVDTGHDVLIERNGTGLDTSYSIVPAKDPSPISAGARANLHKMEDLDAIANQDKPGVSENAVAKLLSLQGIDLAKQVTNQSVAGQLSNFQDDVEVEDASIVNEEVLDTEEEESLESFLDGLKSN